MDIMNEEEMRNIIKDKLKKLSKEELMDVLTDICMENPAFRMKNVLSSLQCTNIRDSINGIQQVMYGKRRWKIWCFARKVMSVERIRVYLGYMN